MRDRACARAAVDAAAARLAADAAVKRVAARDRFRRAARAEIARPARRLGPEVTSGSAPAAPAPARRRRAGRRTGTGARARTAAAADDAYRRPRRPSAAVKTHHWMRPRVDEDDRSLATAATAPREPPDDLIEEKYPETAHAPGAALRGSRAAVLTQPHSSFVSDFPQKLLTAHPTGGGGGPKSDCNSSL